MTVYYIRYLEPYNSPYAEFEQPSRDKVVQRVDAFPDYTQIYENVFSEFDLGANNILKSMEIDLNILYKVTDLQTIDVETLKGITKSTNLDNIGNTTLAPVSTVWGQSDGSFDYPTYVDEICLAFEAKKYNFSNWSDREEVNLVFLSIFLQGSAIGGVWRRNIPIFYPGNDGNRDRELTVPTVTKPESPNHYWTFDNVLTDSYGSLDWTNNGTSYNASGINNQCVEADYLATEYLAISSATTIPSGTTTGISTLSRTYNFWTNNEVFYSQLNGGDIQIDGTSITVVFSNGLGGPTANANLTVTYPTSWTMLTLVVEIGVGAKAYVNGSLADSDSPIYLNYLSGSALSDATLLTDRAKTDTSGARMDEVGIWNYVLTEEEIRYLYSNGLGNFY